MDKGTSFGTESWLIVRQEVAGVLSAVDKRDFSAVVDAFNDAERRWFFSGQGRSGLVAQMSAMRFMHLGLSTYFVGEATAPSIRKGDGLLIVSGSGETPVSLGYAKIASGEGATVVAITQKPTSSLAQIANLALFVPTVSTGQFGGSLFEQSSLLLLDAVVMQIASRIQNAHLMMSHRHTNLQ